MAQVLDAIIREDIFEGPEAVNSDFISESFDISKTEDDFSVQLTYDNGAGVSMTLSFEVSNDNTNFSKVDNSDQVITDPTGSHIWDIASSGTVFGRVTITVASGTIDLQKIEYVGKRRH